MRQNFSLLHFVNLVWNEPPRNINGFTNNNMSHVNGAGSMFSQQYKIPNAPEWVRPPSTIAKQMFGTNAPNGTIEESHLTAMGNS